MSSTGGTSASTARSFWIYFWIYTGLVLGALASVSANVAYTYIPPHLQPPWWPRSRLWDPAAYIPPPGDVAVAVFCPVAIFILTEVITRPRWREGKLSFAVRAVSAVMVGLPVAVASYLHLCSLLEYYSTIPVIAYTLPLTVDGLMLACTAALQLTGTQSTGNQSDQSRDGPSFSDVVVALPHPRAALDDAEADPSGVEDLPGDIMTSRRAVLSTADTTEEFTSPPVGFALSSGGRPPGPVGQPDPTVGVADGPRAPTLTPPVGSVADRLGPAPPPVGLLDPPVGAVLLPLEPAVPPHARLDPGSGPPVGKPGTGAADPPVSDSIGGPGPDAVVDVAGRPVPFGRLGTADLSDIQIIALALEDNPVGKITGTALRKDFGVGPSRAARIRDSIARRRLTSRLAGRIRETIEERQAAENLGGAEGVHPDAALVTSEWGENVSVLTAEPERFRPSY